MHDAWKPLLYVCGSIITLAGAASILWWLVKPRIQEWVESELIRPVRETHHQVTVNQHASDEPTVLDKLDELKQESHTHGLELESLHSNLAGLTHVVLEHLRTSSD